MASVKLLSNSKGSDVHSYLHSPFKGKKKKGSMNKKTALEPANHTVDSKVCSMLEDRGLCERAPNFCPLCRHHSPS